MMQLRRENPKEKLTFLEVKFKDFFNGQKILIEKSRAWLLKNALVFAFSQIAFGFWSLLLPDTLESASS